ncbi:MAG: hypothetical protein V7L11_10695 [Nostoc sp.]|uniref:hypothetical protein n=1 Tax=Nostoc sp. TaxID=1180 RepID=UPI002FF5501B
MTTPPVSTLQQPPQGATSVQKSRMKGSVTPSEQRLLDNWLNIQAINLMRHAKSLRPFTKDEFGTGPVSPSEAHIEAVNRFIDKFRSKVVEMARWVEAATNAARREPTTERLQVLLERKQVVGDRVLYVEGIWDFYFDLFVQRLSSFGERLRTVDRIAANCYEDLYVGLGTAQPTPSLLPFSYANSGFSPATFRRGVPLRRLRHNPNLFPLIMLPQHRLDNVWALSSVLHEVSHNLQADLGLWEEIPARIYQRLTTEGRFSPEIARVWANWHKETMADMFALVLGGPAAVESLMDVVGRSPTSTVRFSAFSVHPTPYLRVFINLILLRRLGFDTMAGDLTRVWQRLYPRLTPEDIPPAFMKTFYPAAEMVVDTMVFQPYRQFANKSLAQVVKFGPAQMEMVDLAARRLAAGQDPVTVPIRFMISAARLALDKQLATPQVITDNFYRILGRR